MEKVLEVKNLSKKYKGNAYFSIKNLSFDCYCGEVVGMVGKNGAGKSTLIKSIVGLLPYAEGVVRVCGYDVTKNSCDAKRMIGYVPDVSFAFEKMTGMEYLNFIADVYGVTQSERLERIAKLQESIKLGDRIYNLISSYSFGMRQKISVMASIIANPKLWILDEPHTGLDPQTTLSLRTLMQNYAKSGNCVIFSSHNLDIVEKICDRVIIISGGEIVRVVNMQQLKNSGQDLERLFLQVSSK